MSLLNWFLGVRSFIQYGDLPTSYYVKRGLKVGKRFNRQSGTRLDPTNCWLIEIGDDVGMGNKSQILAHDFSMVRHTGYARFGRVIIGNRVNIGANVTILMNVHIGDDVIIGAGSLVNKDIPNGCVVSGVPAKVICKTEDLVNYFKDFIIAAPQFKKTDTNYDGNKLSEETKLEMLKAIDQSPEGVFYVKFRDTCFRVGGEEMEAF